MAEIESPVTGSTRFNDTDDNTGFSDTGFSDRRDSSQLRSEIDRTRAQMDSTFDALENKLTPGQLLEEVWSLFKGGSTAGANKLWQIAREHPLPTAVVGLGVGWMLLENSKKNDAQRFSSDYESGSYRGYSSGRGYDRFAGQTDYNYDDYNYNFEEDSEGRLSHLAHRAKDAVSDAASSAKETLGNATDSARETLHDARERVGDLTDRAKYRASHLTDQAKHRASDLRGQARRQARKAQTGFWQMLEEQPLTVGAATLALGLIAGLSIPSTRKEDELMGETRDRLLDDVKETASEALEKGKQVANAAVETIKEEAQNQDLTASTLADKVRTVAKEATNKVKEEAKNVAPELANAAGAQNTGGQQQGTQPGQPGGQKPARKGTPAPVAGQTTTGPNAGGQPGTQVEGQTAKVGDVQKTEPEFSKR
jgi:gas vesicle protein